MKYIYIAVVSLLSYAVTSCGMKSYGDDAISVKELINEFPTDSVLIGNSSSIYATDVYTFIMDHHPNDKIIHVFDPKTHAHIGSFGKFGQGPAEITAPGQMAYSNDKREVYVFDYGQRKVMSFNVDSALADTSYAPSVKLHFSTAKSFPDRYVHINDTLGFARSIQPGKTKGFVQTLCRYNLSNGTIMPFGNPNEKCYENRSLFDVSPEKGLVAEACSTQDLILIYDFDGNTIKRIEGPHFSNELDRDKFYFTGVTFADNYIICEYSGNSTDKDYYGTNLVVLDTDGNYIKTFNLDKKIQSISYNQPNNSLLLKFDDEMQFGELSLTELLNSI